MTTSNLILTLSSTDIDLIGVALGKLPLEQSLGLWMNLKHQVTVQLTPTPAEVPVPVEPEEAPTDGDDTTNNAAG